MKNLAAASGAHEFGFPPGSSGKMPAVKSGSSSVKLKKMLAGTRQRLILTSCTVAVLLVFFACGNHPAVRSRRQIERSKRQGKSSFRTANSKQRTENRGAGRVARSGSSSRKRGCAERSFQGESITASAQRRRRIPIKNRANEATPTSISPEVTPSPPTDPTPTPPVTDYVVQYASDGRSDERNSDGRAV